MLLRALAAPRFILSLGACVQRDYLVANPVENGMPAGEARYSNNVYLTSRATAPNVEAVPCASIPPSTADERREILRTIGKRAAGVLEQLHPTLSSRSGSSTPKDSAAIPRRPRANVWSILPARGAAPIGGRVARPMALLQPLPNGGGVVMIFRGETALAVLATAVRRRTRPCARPAARSGKPPDVADPRSAQRAIPLKQTAVAALADVRGLPLDDQPGLIGRDSETAR